MTMKPELCLKTGLLLTFLFWVNPLQAQEKKDATITKPVTVVDKELEGGHTTVQTGVAFETTKEKRHPKVKYYANGICISCTIAPCPDPHWVQFEWLECTDDEGKHVSGESESNPPIGSNTPKKIKYSTPDNSDWVVDNSAAGSAYYDKEGATSADGTNLFDRPSGDDKRSWPPNPTAKMKLIKHFQTFKICDGKIVQSWTWSATFTGGPGGTGPEYHADLSPDKALNPAQKEALKGFPEAGLIK